jgi:aryl-alcohol dehydrogenase-like predicted oxidoreductase
LGGITAYGVLSRGLISGHWTKSKGGGRDFRTHSPRFQGENLDRNLALADALKKVALERGTTVAPLAIAWALAQGDDIVPLVGARRLNRLTEALSALDLKLGARDLETIEQAVPRGAASGERYAPAQMAMLDSERARARPA